MKIVALTGSIGMGKTTTAAMFKELGVPIWDADSAVHRIYAQGGPAIGPVSQAFPGILTPDNAIDREALSKIVLNDPAKLKDLEALVHPLVGQDRANFLADARAKAADLVIVDVPLLFETGGQAYVDKVIVVSCNADLQRSRVLARPGMSAQKFDAILARQTPDTEKRSRADYLITTDIGLDDTRKQVGEVYHHLLAAKPQDEEPS
jgi:dephospho-CoA kinase